MSLRYILGLPQSGKTRRIFAEISAALQSGGNKPLLLIVPEQFTMSAEKKLISMLPEPAVTRAQILSFQRLAYHLFARAGAAPGAFLDETGKAMLMRKILNDISGDLRFYAGEAGKTGFAGMMSRQITEFYQYGVTPRALAAAFPENLKFADISLIYGDYADALSAKYLSNDETLARVPQKIEESGFYDGAEVWIDGFFGFTVQELGVIEKLLQRCARVSVSLTINQPAAAFPDLSEYDYFYETKETSNLLTALAKKCGAEVETPLFLEREHVSPEIGFYINNWQSGRQYQSEINDIRLVAAGSPRDEVRALAGEVLRLCREGLRYRDVAVVSCDPSYAKELRDTFRQYGIPLFMDEKTDIFYHPLTELLRSAVDICVKNRGYESVFRFLRTGLTGVGRDEADVLENFVLARGIKSYKWDLEWEAEEIVFTGREKLFAALSPFTAALGGTAAFGGSKKYGVKAVCEALLAMLEALDVPTKLERRESEILASGDAEEARRFGQVYTKISGIFDRMTEILGDEAVTMREFGKILDAGLESADLGVIPPSVDQVLVGDFERSRFPEIKSLIILGANEGVLPRPPVDGGLLTDNDRLELAAAGAATAPGGRRRAFYDRLLVYCNLARPRNSLTLIYREKEASSVVEGLKRMFPALGVTRYDGQDIPPAKPLVERICSMLGAYSRGADMPLEYAAAYRLLKKEPAPGVTPGSGGDMPGVCPDVGPLSRREPAPADTGARRTLLQTERLIIDKALGKRVSLEAESVRQLYGNRIVAGVSRLEKYAECPFSYFMRYNLKAGERKVYEVENVDIGSLFHGVLEYVSRAAAEPQGKTWRSLTEPDISALVDAAVDALAPAVGGNLLYSTARRQYMLTQVKRVCKRSVWALAEHIKMGAFEPLGAEVEFADAPYDDKNGVFPGAEGLTQSETDGAAKPIPAIALDLGSGKKMILTGRIDRIDLMDSQGVKYVKIIDYKSGGVKFSLDDVYLGTQLQLPLYMNALLENGADILGNQAERGFQPGGVFYFNIDDPIVGDNADEAELNKQILKSFRMSGLTLAEPEVVAGIDAGASGNSAVAPIYVKKDGTLGANSSAADAEGFGRVLADSDEITRIIGKNILSGDIAPRPVKRGIKTGCDWCEYKAVCGFEQGGGGYRAKGFVKRDG